METWDAITARRNVREFERRPIGDEISTGSSRRVGALPRRRTGSRGTSS